MLQGNFVRLALLTLVFGMPMAVLAGTPNAPIAITSSGTASAPDIALDGIGNLMVTYLDNGHVTYTSSVSQFQSAFPITTNGNTPSTPSIAASGVLNVSIVYDEPSAAPGAMGNDIQFVSSSGGGFNPASNFTFNTVPESSAVASRTSTGSLHVAYQADPMGLPSEIHSNLGATTLVAPGAAPALAEVPGSTYIAYQRGGDVYVRQFTAGAFLPEEIITGIVGPNTDANIAGTGGGVVHVVFVNAGALYHSQNSGGSFASATQIEAGPIQGVPRIDANFGGDVAVTYAIGGQVLVREWDGAVFSAPVTYSGASTTASDPTIAVDNSGYVRVVYADGSNLYRANNVPAPNADFTASVTSGEVLLEVDFTNMSTGVIEQILWDFGDGATSLTTNPSHTYSIPDSYTVSLTVTGPGGSSTLSLPDHIEALPPTNILSFPDLDVTTGATIVHPIELTHPDPVQGFQVLADFNNNFMAAVDVRITETFTEAAAPEFLETNFVVSPSGVNSYLAIVTIFDVQAPFLAQTLPPAPTAPQTIGYFEYTIPIGLPVGLQGTIEFMDGVFPPGPTPPLNNVIAVNGASISPFLDHGTITIVPPDVTFLRGDANSNGGIDLSDTVFILAFLFSGGAAPTCPDAADPNDTGMIDIADAVYLLSYLFSSGLHPRYPFPTPGLDPTPDSLDPCM